MQKNVKSIFLVATLLFLLVGVSAISASEVSDDTTVLEDTVDTVAPEVTITTNTDNSIETTKNLEKTNKNIKTATKTVEVNNYDELTTTINNAVNDTDNDEYIINLNEGTYEINDSVMLNGGYKKPNITINGNNQTLTSSIPIMYGLQFNNGCNITFNNAIMNHRIENYANNITLNKVISEQYIINQANTNLTLNNSTINYEISNAGTLIIDENTIFSDSTTITGNGKIITDDIYRLIPYMSTLNGNYTFEDMTINGSKTNNGNITINNSNINVLSNNGNLTIEDSIINSTTTNANGITIINNSNITNQITVIGNATVINSNINKFTVRNYGNLTIINCTLNTSDNSIRNYCTLILADDVIFGENFYLNRQNLANIVCNDSAKIAPYLNSYYNGNYTLENITINITKQNEANLTIRNATVNTTINNYGNLTICDDVLFGENTIINGNGQIIINDTTKITPYLTTYNGNYTIENTTIKTQKTNNANLTIKNTTINATINNNGNLTIEDDVIFAENAAINGNGQIIINDTTKITPYLTTYNGNYTIENTTINAQKTNNANLTIKNTTINATITNNGNMTIVDSDVNNAITTKGTLIIKNSTLNNRITNNGTLIIEDDCILGTNFNIFAESNNTIVSNITNITSYITQYRGNNFTIENQTITKILYNNAFTNITIINSVINAQINNYYGTVRLINSTLNATFNQQHFNSILILSDDSILGENFSINTQGQFIANVTNERAPYVSRFDNGTVSNLNLEKIIYGNNLTMINSSNTKSTTLTNSTVIDSLFTGQLTLTDSTLINTTINHVEIMSGLYNSLYTSGEVTVSGGIIDTETVNDGVLIISDNTVIGENFSLDNNGEIIINDTNKIAPYISSYYGNITMEDKVLNGDKTNYDNLTLINTTVNNQLSNEGNSTLINSTTNGNIINNGELTLNNSIIKGNITNNGYLTVDEGTTFDENIKITGNGYIITDNITRLLPYLSTINGNYTIKDTTLDKIYNFIGDIKLDNCTITAGFDNNYGLLNITNSVINVSDNYDYWIENSGVIIIDENTQIVNGEINDLGTVYYGNVPDDYIYDSRVHIVNNKTLDVYFKNGLTVLGLTVLVNPGDTLDFQGTINRPVTNRGIRINKPVNIITSTNDGKLDNLTEVTYDSGSSGSNITGLYTFNTQTYITGSNSVFDNISNVVDSKRVGTGVGQTSVRGANNITIKNSYIYTRNNGGSSSLVLAQSNYCNLINNTVVGGGGNGNLIYFTTYGTVVEPGQMVNHDNKVLNNTILGPNEESGVCIGFALSGCNNIFDGNIINYTGGGVGVQWGSGQDGDYSEDSNIITGNNTISNNKLYSGCGISGGDYVYNNYVELGEIYANNNSIITNNTCYDLQIFRTSNITIENNTILNQLYTYDALNANTTVTNNNINKINITTNTSDITFKTNNITGQVNIEGNNINFTENNITNNAEYTITGKGSNNTITNNYLVAKTTFGDASVNLNPESNTIENNKPKENILIIDTTTFTAGQTATITASIYNDGELVNTINKGKITFKVNGKTLKDTNGKVIYAKVVNGTATIENYLVPDDWSKDGTTIEAVYSGSTQCEKLTSEKTEINIEKATPTLTTSNITAAAGETITLTTTITDNDKVINNGKIVFKINGKTVKDANGKVIYAKVVNNQVSVEYTLPADMKAKDYNITATFISSDYERIEDTKTLTITA